MSETPAAAQIATPPDASPLPQTGGSFVRDTDGRLRRAGQPGKPRKTAPRRDTAADPVKEG